MRNSKSILVVVMFVFVAVSCSKNDDPIEQPKAVEVKTISNLYAPQGGGRGKPISGEFIKFSFKKGTTIIDDSWDIAFRGTRILVNGGSAIGLIDEPIRTGNASLALLTGIFSEINAPEDNSVFTQDAKDTYALPIGGNGWYTYDRVNTRIDRITGKVLVIKTIDGNYAKMEIRSYYKDYTSSDSKYYTFDYVYNPIVGDKNLE